MHTRGLQQPVFFRHLRNLLSFSSHFNAVPPVQNGQPRDPLDVCLYLAGFMFDSTIFRRSLLPLPESMITHPQRTQLRDIHIRIPVNM